MLLSLLLAFQTVQATGGTMAVRAVVSDSKGVPLRDLALADVSLSEEGATRQISRFEKDERPSRVALVIDSSAPFATAYRLQFIDAAKAFVASLPSTTHLTVWTAGDRPDKVIDDLDLAADGTARSLESSLRRVAPQGGNRTLDAMVEASEDLVKREGERKILVFISGTGPGFANDTREGVVERLRRNDIEVTGVEVAERGETTGGDVAQEDYDYVFGESTRETGGRLERTLSVMGTAGAMTRVAADLRSTYRVAYLPANGKGRSRIELNVARPSVKVRLSKPRKEISSP